MTFCFLFNGPLTTAKNTLPIFIPLIIFAKKALLWLSEWEDFIYLIKKWNVHYVNCTWNICWRKKQIFLQQFWDIFNFWISLCKNVFSILAKRFGTFCDNLVLLLQFFSKSNAVLSWKGASFPLSNLTRAFLLVDVCLLIHLAFPVHFCQSLSNCAS